ncbi:MFS transporter (plasmid) [Arthrobacter sp. G.S.26]|uniref:MFS transporter n=1 Tax=Arthrobacter sp. G.S.26 TaxID=3433706 RepID=UPI003D77081D
MERAEHSTLGAEQPVTSGPDFRKQARRVISAGTVGHALEWFDFGVYAYLATVIAGKFFPSTDPTTSLLATLATFGVGFVARPAGAFVFGRLGDRLGRRTVLLLTLLLMAVGTLGIGITPTHAEIGVWAAVILVVCRLLQGFSAGGEVTTAAVFMIEWAPKGRRGLFGSFMQIGSVLGLMSASLCVALCYSTFGTDTMNDWAWRVPFIVGVLIVPIGYIIRRRTEETPAFAKEQAEQAESVHPGSRKKEPVQFRPMIQAFLLLMFWSVGFYFFLTYMPTFLQREFSINPTEALWINVTAMSVHIITVPITAILSDRIGRRPLLIAGCIAFILVPVPLFAYLDTGAPLPMVYLAVILIGVLLALYTGPAATTGAEFFKTATRSSGYAIGYNLSAVVFGGFTPYLATWLIEATGTKLAPVYYLSLTAIAGAIFIWSIKETAKDQEMA